jgi:phage terminase large subunit
MEMESEPAPEPTVAELSGWEYTDEWAEKYLRGGGLQLWKYEGPEVMLSGPSETGKTVSSLHKLNSLMWKYPGAQAAMIRKVGASIPGSVLVTFKRIINGSAIKSYGGEKPEWFDYPNGSRIFVGGLDNRDKILSSERDFIYVNQAEEIDAADWEYLTTRATGRGATAPYTQVFGDCNPGPPTHWIKNRASLRVFESRHEDNPSLFDATGRITAQGQRTLAILENLTGVRKLRLRFGMWVAAEGVIYELYDRRVHLKTLAEIPSIPKDENGRPYIPPDWPRYWVVDFGYTNPFVFQNWAVDPDGRLIRYREIYRTKRLVEDHCKDIKAATEGEPSPREIICDHDAEDRATLERHLGIRTKAAHKSVSDGIQALASRLKVADDGRPRIYFVSDALVSVDEALVDAKKPTCTEQEIESYVWKDGVKDSVPVKENDHGMDAARYMVAQIDLIGPKSWATDTSALSALRAAAGIKPK